MYKYLSALLVSVLVLSGCANRPSSVMVDPAIMVTAWQAEPKLVVGLSVKAPEQRQAVITDESIQLGHTALESRLKKTLINALTNQGYQIGANQFFNDFTLAVDLTEFSVIINKDWYKDELEVKATVMLTLNKNKVRFSKTFSRSQTLTVAGQTTESESNGLVNQVLGELLTSAINHPEIVAFITNQ